jgi:hypothetical protein
MAALAVAVQVVFAAHSPPVDRRWADRVPSYLAVSESRPCMRAITGRVQLGEGPGQLLEGRALLPAAQAPPTAAWSRANPQDALQTTTEGWT